MFMAASLHLRFIVSRRTVGAVNASAEGLDMLAFSELACSDDADDAVRRVHNTPKRSFGQSALQVIGAQ